MTNRAPRPASLLRFPWGEWRVTRISRSAPGPLMKMSANSSCSYCVTNPDGYTLQVRPSIAIDRVGIGLSDLHFLVDPRGVEDHVGRVGVRGGEHRRVGRLRELDEG